MAGVYPRVDLVALAHELGVQLGRALIELRALYADIDTRNVANTAGLDLPCHRGCDACCHESVFITPLEFFAAWDDVQRRLDDDARTEIVSRALRIYEENAALFARLGEPPPEGAADHLEVARQLRFRCPLLGDDGTCRVYDSRELYARLFGCSFDEATDGGVYGCDLVGAHLAGRTVSLLRVRAVAHLLDQLPLTFMRRPYPYYLHLLYE